MTGPAQPIEWYLARDGKQYGPLSDVELMKLVELRHLKDEDLIWRAGLTDWKPAAELFPQAFAAPEPETEAEPEPVAAPATAAAPAPTAQDASWQQAVVEAYGSSRAQSDAHAQASSPAAAQSPASTAQARSDHRSRHSPLDPLPGEPGQSDPGAAPTADRLVERQQTALDRGGAGQQPRAGKRPWFGPEDQPQAAPAAAGLPVGKVNGHHHEHLARAEPRFDLNVDPYRGPQQRNGAASPYATRPDAGPAPTPMSPGQRGTGAPASLDVRGPRPGPAPGSSGGAKSPKIADDDFDDGDAEDPPKKRRLGGLVAVMFLLAAMVGGVWFYFTNPTVLTMAVGTIGLGQGDSTPAAPKDGKAVLASASAKEAVLAPAKALPAAPLQNFPESAAGIDQLLQSGYLWQVIRAEFPEWYDERLRESARMVTEKRPDDTITKHLIDSLIQLRRKNAEHAFAASLPKMQQLARRFRDSLDTLTKHSQVACFSLISNGEGTRGMVGLFRDPAYGPALQAGLAAVFEAIADGRRTPQTRLSPRRSDYDLLTKELKALGWSEDDLGRFADPDELAKLPPEKVCNMVREWFSAHLAVPDKQIQLRLLVESLKPVVSG